MVVSPLFSLFKTKAVQKIENIITGYSTPFGAVAAICYALHDLGFRVVAEGGVSAIYPLSPCHTDQTIEDDMNLLKSIYSRQIDRGDPYYYRNLEKDLVIF